MDFLTTEQLWEHYKLSMSPLSQKLIQQDEIFRNRIYQEFKADLKSGDITLNDDLLNKQYKERYPNKKEVKKVSRAKNEVFVKSRVEGWPDWSTSSLPKDVREAADYLIKNGYEDKDDVKSAFYRRQTSCMSDDYHAEENDNLKILRIAEKYKNEKKSDLPDTVKKSATKKKFKKSYSAAEKKSYKAGIKKGYIRMAKKAGVYRKKKKRG